MRLIEDDFRRHTAARRFNAAVMAAFGVVSLLIGALGIYGTMAFVVGREIRGIGLRMALGASPSRMLRSVLGHALRRVALGIGIGLTGALALSNALTSFVFGIRPTEPAVYVGVGAFLLVMGLAAALAPALHAARLDPLAALRHE